MNGARPIGFNPNLPEKQRFVQRLADQFHSDERGKNNWKTVMGYIKNDVE